MPNLIYLKVDVNLIDKARLFQGKQREDGTAPKYLDLVLVPLRQPGKYGDTHIVKQSCTKEERAAKKEMPIIGNATEQEPRRNDAPPHSAPRRNPTPPAGDTNLDEDVPF